MESDTRLEEIVVDLHWMARRYADGRQSYATGLFNDHTRALLRRGIKLNATGDETIWARDGMGRNLDGLSDAEAAQGRDPDWRGDGLQRHNEELEEEVASLKEQLAQFQLTLFKD